MKPDCPLHPDCEDKSSTHYFICHMTQDEWGTYVSELFPDGNVPAYKYNMIRKLTNQRQKLRKANGEKDVIFEDLRDR